MCLAQGHNAVKPVRLKPAAPRSQVMHSSTEALRSQIRTVCLIEQIWWLQGLDIKMEDYHSLLMLLNGENWALIVFLCLRGPYLSCRDVGDKPMPCKPGFPASP